MDPRKLLVQRIDFYGEAELLELLSFYGEDKKDCYYKGVEIYQAADIDKNVTLAGRLVV